MTRKAVYAGTFDPPTNGHLWMITEAARLFDEVVVAIGVNPDKKTVFSAEERVAMLAEATKGLPGVRVESFANQFLIRYAQSIDVSFIIRGIRNSTDYDYEKSMRYINGDLGSAITTVFLMPPREMVEISSSVVRGLIGPDGWEKAVSRYVPKSVFVRLIEKHHTIWRNLVAAGAKDDEQMFWEKTLIPYFSPDRAYHSSRHIFSMLADFYFVKDRLKNPLAVELAIWQHDIVYDTRTTDNEEKSAAAAANLVRNLGLPDELGAAVSAMILTTKHAAGSTDPDTQFLLDMDLAVLGKSDEEFDEYEIGIRKEYAHVSFEQFAARRAAILRAFLDRPRIYLTDFFRDRYEAAARRNLARSIAKLKIG